MAREQFLINPPRRKRKRVVRRKRKAGSGRRRKAVVVAAPVRRRRRKRVVKVVRRRRVSRRRGHRSAITGMKRHRPVVYGSGRRWRRSKWSKSLKSHVMINPAMAMVGNRPRRRHRRSYRRNPAIMGLSFDGLQRDLMNAVPLAVTGIASGIIVNMVPGFFNLTNVWANYGLKAGVALLGGRLVGKSVGSDHGLIWTVVGVTSVVQDLVRQFMPGVIPGLSGGYANYYDATSIAAFPQEMGAFPQEEFYPDSGSYAGMGESAYPY